MSPTPITLGNQQTPADTLSDRELLAGIRWRNSADRRLVQTAGAGDVQAFGEALGSHAGFSRKVRGSDRESESCDVFLQPLWSLRAVDGAKRPQQLPALLKLCAQTGPKPDRKTVATISRRTADLLDEAGTAAEVAPLVQLSWLTILAWGSSLISDEMRARLWLRAFREARKNRPVDSDPDDPTLTDDQRLLLYGELPFLQGLVFQEVRGSRQLIRQGERQLRDGLEAGTDTDGMPHSRLLDRLTLWLSPLCRAALAGRRFDTAWWNRSAALRFSDLVMRSAALTRSSGEFALGNGVALAPASLLKAASSVAEYESSRHSQSFVESVANDVASLTHGKSKPTRQANRVKSQGRPGVGREKRADRPASQSDWARLACLRNNWDLGADACVIAYDEAQPRIDLTALGTTVISGNWDVRTSIDDVPVATDAEWECVCWFSDKDVDYLELQRADDQVSIQRQAVLSRTDHFLYLADTVRSHSDSTRRIEHACELPLASAANAIRDALTRESLLKIGSLKVRVLPVSLEQDATIASAGDLSVRDNSIQFRQSTAGPGLMSALVLDWSPVRRKEAALWRGLTIVEDGRILSQNEAAGTHLRMGRHQWLFYRSLTPGRVARTVLGQHTANETVIGEMNSSGDFEPLVIVEGDTT